MNIIVRLSRVFPQTCFPAPAAPPEILRPAVAPTSSYPAPRQQIPHLRSRKQEHTKAVRIAQSSAIKGFRSDILATNRRITATAARHKRAMTAALFSPTRLSATSMLSGGGPKIARMAEFKAMPCRRCHSVEHTTVIFIRLL